MIDHEEEKIRVEILKGCGGLPEQDEIIIFPGGLILTDLRNPITGQEDYTLGTTLVKEIYCG